MAIGETDWIPDIHAACDSVEKFDVEAKVEVIWPENANIILKTKQGCKKSNIKGGVSYEARVLAFGGEFKSNLLHFLSYFSAIAQYVSFVELHYDSKY